MYFRYGGTWIKVDRTREQHTLDLHMGIPWETVTLTAFGRNKQLYYDILEEGMFQILSLNIQLYVMLNYTDKSNYLYKANLNIIA